MIRSILSLAALLLLLGLTGCASDGEKPPKADESWRTASQRVPDQDRRPSPSELAKKAKARDLLAEKDESESEAESEAESETEEQSAEDSEEPVVPAKPIRFDPEGPEDRDSYVPLEAGMPRPVAVHNPQPSYSDEAREAGVEGVVIVAVLVDETGAVRGVDLLKGLPGGLVLETYKTVKTWRFEPVVVDGQPTKVIGNFTIHFRLGGQKKSDA